MSVEQLDPIIHPTHRLRICSMLQAGSEVELSVIKDNLDLSASALSKQVSALVDAGYVKQRRGGSDSRKLWLSLTKSGQSAYRGHIAALKSIVD